MPELLQAAIAGPNIIPTALLVLVLVYWVAVILGLFDLDTVDWEIDSDLGSDSGSSIVWLNSALAFFNLGKIPLMLFLTFLVLPLWVLSILTNHFLYNTSALLGLLFLLPAFVVSLFVAKVLTMPFVKLFAKLEKEHESAATIIGQVCTVVLPTSHTELGQATVRTTGAPLLLNIKTSHGPELRKGQTALVIDYNAQSRFYLVEPYEMLE